MAATATQHLTILEILYLVPAKVKDFDRKQLNFEFLFDLNIKIGILKTRVAKLEISANNIYKYNKHQIQQGPRIGQAEDMKIPYANFESH